MAKNAVRSALWAVPFAVVAGLAILWVQRGCDLAGGLAFTLNRLPRHLLLSLGGPDIDKAPLLDLLTTALFVFLMAFAILVVAAKAKPPSVEGTRALPALAVLFGVLLLYEIGYLSFGEMPHYRFGQAVFTFLVPWHAVALGVTGAFIVFSKRFMLPRWVSRGYWLLMFAMALAVLFPMRDSL